MKYKQFVLVSGIALLLLLLQYHLPSGPGTILKARFGRLLGVRRDDSNLSRFERLVGVRQCEGNVSSAYTLNYITECMAMKDPPCSDATAVADLNKSVIEIQGTRKLRYHLGEQIPVSIRLLNGRGEPLTRGGAVLRARMTSTMARTATNAHVIDHRNGSYTAMFTAEFVGNFTIKVMLAYTVEAIRAMYYIRLQVHQTLQSSAVFSVAGHQEIKPCHTLREGLAVNTATRVCNLTGDNSGMPWFCVKPRSKRLYCEDWTGVKTTIPQTPLPLTPCEATAMDRARKFLESTVPVTVVAESLSGSTITQAPMVPCSRYNTTALWTRSQPTGFLYKGQWRLHHCKGCAKPEKMESMKNRHLLLLGDSTVRQWYMNIVARYGCTHLTEHIPSGTWHKRTLCKNGAFNFTVEWLPHSQPFIGHDEVNRYTRTSITRHLEETGSYEHVVVMFHLYTHMIPYHHDAFRLKIRKIRKSVEDLLSRNKYAQVLFKGFHSFEVTGGWFRRLSDYYALVYRHILFEEFRGLHDKVVYLDHQDISACVSHDIHPPEYVVSAMVDQLFDYLCT